MDLKVRGGVGLTGDQFIIQNRRGYCTNGTGNAESGQHCRITRRLEPHGGGNYTTKVVACLWLA